MKKEPGIRLLFSLCWCAYFSAYIGRLNYSAALTDMIYTEGFGKEEAGLIGTAFFFAYGIGQFVSGFLGDRLPAKGLVFTGLFVSGICNLLMSQSREIGFMIAVWCANGLVQALIWSPMLRLFSDYCKPEIRPKLCAALNSAVPVGTMAAYGITAVMLGISGWRLAFHLAGISLLTMAFIWFLGIARVQKNMPATGQNNVLHRQKKSLGNNGKLNGILNGILIESGLLILFAVLFVQGALKDGVTTWIPVYIQETYGVSPILAVAGTMVIPLCNLFGVWLAAFAGRQMARNEVAVSAVFFAVCTGALAALWMISGRSMALSMVMLALSTTAMMAVNTMLTAVLPAGFGAVGKASSMSGLLNSAVYAGCAVSAYGIGSMAVYFGWRQTILIWAVMAAVSIPVCGAVAGRWGIYRRKLSENKG